MIQPNTRSCHFKAQFARCPSLPMPRTKMKFRQRSTFSDNATEIVFAFKPSSNPFQNQFPWAVTSIAIFATATASCCRVFAQGLKLVTGIAQDGQIEFSGRSKFQRLAFCCRHQEHFLPWSSLERPVQWQMVLVKKELVKKEPETKPSPEEKNEKNTSAKIKQRPGMPRHNLFFGLRLLCPQVCFLVRCYFYFAGFSGVFADFSLLFQTCGLQLRYESARRNKSRYRLSPEQYEKIEQYDQLVRELSLCKQQLKSSEAKVELFVRLCKCDVDCSYDGAALS